MTLSDLSRMTRRDFESLLGDLTSDDQSVHDAAKAALERVCYLKWPRPYMLGTEAGGHMDAQTAHLRDSVAVDCLLDALRQGHPRARVFAANILWVAREKAAIPLLIDCLTAKQKEVRIASASALGHLADLSAVEPLVQLLADADVDVRSAAAAGLGNLGDIRAVAALLSQLRSKNWRDRQSALHGLSECLRPLYGHAARPAAPPAAEALPAIRCALADPHQRVRKAAKSALSSYDWNRRRSSAERNAEP
jgi:HEAT repeat protein